MYVCGSTMYIVIVSASLLVIPQSECKILYSWGNTCSLSGTTYWTSVWLKYKLHYNAHCTVLCIVNGYAVRVDNQLTGHVKF
jgi:hypothetical protein